MEREIEIYQDSRGKRPFSDWLFALSDIQARAKIRVRLDRLRLGNLGDCKFLGNNIGELKIDFGPGYRVYFGKIGIRCVLLLCAGDKRTQNKDIEKAKEYFEDYQLRGKNHG